MGAPVIETKDLVRHYVTGATTVKALRGVNLTVEEGEMVALMGASGSGKSTLLNLLGCLDRPTSGSYRLGGVAVETLDDDGLSDLRNRKLGFVFQGFHLLARTTALENVTLPLLYDRDRRFKDPAGRARECLERVGLGERTHHFPNELSGGQQQRVAIARALVNEPSVVLADEPTGALDSKTSLEVMALFQDLHANGVTLVIVTHEPDVAAFCRRLVRVKDGLIVDDHPVETRSARAELEEVS